jgi:hypothetical protein
VQRQESISFPRICRPTCGPPSLLCNGYKVLFLRVKCLGCEVDCLHFRRGKIKNEWSCTSHLPVCIHSVGRHGCTICTVVTLFVKMLLCSCVIYFEEK